MIQPPELSLCSRTEPGAWIGACGPGLLGVWPYQVGILSLLRFATRGLLLR